MEQWLDLWLSDIKAHDGTRPATLVLYQGLADHYVKPVIGPVRLDRLTPRHVQRLIVETRNAETSRGRPPSAATQRQIHTLIRNALGDAHGLELVTRNVAAQVKAPPMARQRRPDLTVEQARHLLEVIEGERLEAFYVLALTTGLRRGELLGLRWADVDLNSRQLHVRRALQRVGGKLRFVEPKTSTSVRVVVVPKLAVRHLARHRARQDAERLARGATWRDHDLVFASSVGTPIAWLDAVVCPWQGLAGAVAVSRSRPALSRPAHPSQAATSAGPGRGTMPIDLWPGPRLTARIVSGRGRPASGLKISRPWGGS